MKVIVTESKLTKVIHTYLNMTFKGFDNCTYEWGQTFCRELGIGADPYAVGFVLPEGSNYLFKLVDSKHYDDDGYYPDGICMTLSKARKTTPDITNKKFDTIAITQTLYDVLHRFVGNIDIWREPFLSVINNVYNTHATNLLYFE